MRVQAILRTCYTFYQRCVTHSIGDMSQVFSFQPSGSAAGGAGFLAGIEEAAPRMVRSPSSASAKAATQKRGRARRESQLRKGMSYNDLAEESGAW